MNTVDITFRGFSKTERRMTIRLLGHRDFWETFHLVSQAMAGGVDTGNGRASFNPLSILRSLDFNTFEKIARKVLSYGLLDGVGTVEDPFECDHFKAHPDELYSAVYSAIKSLNPEMFPKPAAETTKPADVSAPQDMDGGQADPKKSDR